MDSKEAKAMFEKYVDKERKLSEEKVALETQISSINSQGEKILKELIDLTGKTTFPEITQYVKDLELKVEQGYVDIASKMSEFLNA